MVPTNLDVRRENHVSRLTVLGEKHVSSLTVLGEKHVSSLTVLGENHVSSLKINHVLMLCLIFEYAYLFDMLIYLIWISGSTEGSHDYALASKPHIGFDHAPYVLYGSICLPSIPWLKAGQPIIHYITSRDLGVSKLRHQSRIEMCLARSTLLLRSRCCVPNTSRIQYLSTQQFTPQFTLIFQARASIRSVSSTASNQVELYANHTLLYNTTALFSKWCQKIWI